MSNKNSSLQNWNWTSRFGSKAKLDIIIALLWQVTVFSAFWGTCLFPIDMAFGRLYLFRFMVFILTFILLWKMFNQRINPIKHFSKEQFPLLLFIGVYLTYGSFSISIAIDAVYTIRKLVNVFFSCGFLILFLLIVNNKQTFKCTLANCTVNLLLIEILSIYEIISRTGLFNPAYEGLVSQMGMGIPILSFGNPNDLSSAIMLILPFCLYFLFSEVEKNGGLQQFVLKTIGLIMGIFAIFIFFNADARLVIISAILFNIMLFVFFLLRKRKLLYIPIFSLLFMLVLNFLIYAGGIDNATAMLKGNKESRVSMMKAMVDPSAVVGTKEEYVVENMETGEKILNPHASGGIRANLIVSGLKISRDSYYVGVGLGNAEQLLKEKKYAVPRYIRGEYKEILNFHSYAICLLAEFGIFIALPAISFAIILLITVFRRLISRKDYEYQLLYSMVLASMVMFPILSSAPSDALSLYPMWIVIGILGYLCGDKEKERDTGSV